MAKVKPFVAILDDLILPADHKYHEISRLASMLTEANIPFECKELYDGYQICYPAYCEGRWKCSAVQHYFSYGNEDDKLEIMGLLTPEEKKQDGVLGHLTAEDVFERIKAHWERSKEEL